jgi:hypothetical protein
MWLKESGRNGYVNSDYLVNIWQTRDKEYMAIDHRGERYTLSYRGEELPIVEGLIPAAPNAYCWICYMSVGEEMQRDKRQVIAWRPDNHSPFGPLIPIGIDGDLSNSRYPSRGSLAQVIIFENPDGTLDDIYDRTYADWAEVAGELRGHLVEQSRDERQPTPL